MESLIYMCGMCNETFDEAAISSHVCWNQADENDEDGSAVRIEGEEFKINSHLADNKKPFTKPKRDGWKDEDVRRLLEIYIKNFKALPYKDRSRSHFLWDRVMRDMRQYGNFSRFLVQSKFKKLKNACRSIMSGPSTSYEWPYYQQMIEIHRLESESSLTDENVESENNAEEETESDNEDTSDTVQGLRRWTIKETRHLIQVYTKHLPRFMVKGQRRKILWNDVLAELEYNLPERFSVYQIRAKIRNVLNTYRSIVDGKRKKNTSYWPLLNDVAKLAKLEQMSDDYGNDDEVRESVNALLDEETDAAVEDLDIEDETEEKSSGIRWNKEETLELLNQYKDNLMKLFYPSGESHSDAWSYIARQVNSIRRRKITPKQAKEKIDCLKLAFAKGEFEVAVPELNDLLNEITEEESTLRSSIKQEDSEPVDEPQPKKKKKMEDGDTKLNTGNAELPSWYKKYEEDTNRRHKEKMYIIQNIITVLEKIVHSSSE